MNHKNILKVVIMNTVRALLGTERASVVLSCSPIFKHLYNREEKRLLHECYWDSIPAQAYTCSRCGANNLHHKEVSPDMGTSDYLVCDDCNQWALDQHEKDMLEWSLEDKPMAHNQGKYFIQGQYPKVNLYKRGLLNYPEQARDTDGDNDSI